jgi:hypothetical protein
MAQLHLPEGAEAGFRLELTNAFGWRFSINVYGAGHRGWFVASRRDVETGDSGSQELTKGDWRSLLHMIDMCGFWGLPETIPWPENEVVDDGDWLVLAGRDGERYHKITRFVWRERGLDTVAAFLRRVSGLFPPPPPPSQINEDGSVGPTGPQIE